MLLGCKVMTPAHGGVLVRGTDTRLPCGSRRDGIIGRSKGKDGRCTVRAEFAHSREFGNPVRERYEVQDTTERAALGIPVQAHDNYMLPIGVHGLRYEGHEVAEELGLFHDDQARLLVFWGLQQWHQGTRGNGGTALLVVVDDLVRAIAGITGMGNDADGPAEGSVTPDDGQEGGGLAREHGTEKQFETHGCVGGVGFCWVHADSSILARLIMQSNPI